MSTAFQLVGFLLVAIGLWWWWPPAALIIGGLTLFISGGIDEARERHARKAASKSHALKNAFEGTK